MNFLDRHDICSAFVPVDLKTGANAGDFISMKDWHHLTIVFFKSIGTAGDDPIFELKQATVVAGTDTKDLNGITSVFYKQGLDLTAVTHFDEATQAADEHYTDATSAELSGIYVIEIDDTMLDVNNGFDCVQFNVADIGANAQLGCALYILSQPKYTGPVHGRANPLAD